jgi:hypothetical protein
VKKKWSFRNKTFLQTLRSVLGWHKSSFRKKLNKEVKWKKLNKEVTFVQRDAGSGLDKK